MGRLVTLHFARNAKLDGRIAIVEEDGEDDTPLANDQPERKVFVHVDSDDEEGIEVAVKNLHLPPSDLKTPNAARPAHTATLPEAAEACEHPSRLCVL